MSPTENRPGSPAFPPAAGIHGCDSVVHRIDPLKDPNWDARLATWPAASFFHTSAWARVLHGTYGFGPAYFVLESRDGGMGRPTHDPSLHGSGDPCRVEPGNPSDKATEDGSPASRLLQPSPHFHALLPMMEANSWLTGRRGICLPFTDECAPLCDNSESFRCIHEAALAHATLRRWRYLEVRGGKAWFGDAPPSTSFWGHRLDLRLAEEALLTKIDSAGRRAVRKAEQSNLSIEFSQSVEAIRIFYRLHCLTRKRHGVPPQPFVFFANIQRHVLAQNHGWVVLARHGGIAVSGAVFFHSGTSALYKFGASDDRFQHLRGNNLVMWEAIRRYASEGFASLDLGRTSLNNDGLRRFKLSWGPTEYPIDYVRYDLPAGRWVTARDDSSGWYNRVFRILPILVSRLIGAALYRHVA